MHDQLTARRHPFTSSMATIAPNTALSGLPRAFVQAARLHQHDAESLASQARDAGVGFVEQLISAKRMSALDITHFVSDTLGYPLLDPSAFDQTQIPKDAIDRKLMARHLVLPLARRGNRLAVAISNPTNKPALDQIKFQTSLAIDPVVVEDDKLAKLMADMVD